MRNVNLFLFKSGWLNLLILTLMFFVGNSSYGQVSNYAFSQSTGTYSAISGGTLHGTAVDNANYSFTLPFTFNYNGTGYTVARPTSNGFLVLGSNAPSTSQYTPLSSGTTNFAVAALARDLNSTIRSEVIGTAPNRIYVCQWSSAYRYAVGSSENLNAQIRLYETSNIVEIIYGGFTTTNTAAGTGPMQIGMRGSSNADFNNRTTTTDWSASTAGATNSATCAGTTTVFPASGLIFTWAPPVPCAGTPDAGTISNALIRPTCPGTAPSPATITTSGITTGVTGLIYQWEESTNSGGSWANATGGSGATTATYTPPVYAGTPIQYRLKVTCSNSGLLDVSDVVVSVTNPIAPTTQASNITTSALSNTSATINWTSGNGGRRYVVLNSVNSFTNPVGTGDITVAGTVYTSGEQIVYDGTGTSVSVTGLTANTTYYVRVYEYLRCSGTPNTNYYNVTTAANNPGNFTTLIYCVPTYSSGCSGDDMTSVTLGTLSSTGLSCTPPVYQDLSSTQNAIPDLQEATTINLVITFATPGSAQFSRVWIDFDQNNIFDSSESFSLGTSGSSNPVTIPISIPMGAALGQTKMRIRAGDDSAILNTQACGASGSNWGMARDYNVNILKAPSCFPPTALTILNITNTTANLSWTAPSPAPGVGYEWAVTTSATPPASGTQVVGTSASASGLISNTTYYLHVRSECTAGVEFSPWATSGSFTTQIVEPTPYIEPFASTSTPLGYNITGWTIGSVRGVTGNPGNNIYKNLYESAPTGTFTTVNVGPISSGMFLTFDYKNSNYDSPFAGPGVGTGDFTVSVSTDYGNTYTVLSTIGNTASNAWQLYSQDLSAYVGQNVKIRIIGTWVSGDYDLAFDNIKIETPPSCLPPTALTILNITNTTADLTWTAPTPAPGVGYEWAVTTSMTPPASGTQVVGTSASATGLIANTTYYLHVRSECTAGVEYSAWVTSGSFYTGHCLASSTSQLSWISAFSTTGGSTNISHTAGAGASGGYVDLSATNIVSNYIGNPTNFSITSGGPTVGNAIWVDWNNNLVFEAGERMYVSTGYGTTVTGTFAVPAATPNGNYKIRVITDFNNSAPSSPCGNIARGEYKDFTFTVTDIPPCPDPSGITITNITNTSATATWTAAAPAPIAGYQYYFNTSNTTPDGNTIPTGSVGADITMVNLTGLTTNTTYYLWIRSNCTVNQSNWIAASPFTTTNLPYVVYLNPAPKTINDVLDIYFEDYDVINNFYTDGQTSIWMYGGVQVGGNTFQYVQGDFNNTSTLVQFTQQSPGLYKATVKLADYFCIPEGTIVEGLNILFRNQFGIGGNNQTNDLFLNLTDQALEVNPPTNLMSGNIQTQSADISWTAPLIGANKGYEYAASTTNTPPSSGISTNNSSVSLSGLSPSSTYYFWAKTKGCGSDVSEWSVVGTFDTPCLPPTITGTTPASRCGTGTVTLGASASEGDISWFSSETGGSPLGSGTSFVTPTISTTTTYWAGAITAGVTENAGRNTYAGTDNTTGSSWGLVFNVVNDPITINSVDIYSVGAGGNITLELRDNLGALIQTVGPFAYPSGTTGSPITVTLPLNLSVPVGTGYRLLASSMAGSLIREFSGITSPYTSTSGNVVITSGYLGGTSTTYYWFYNWEVSSGCAGPRTSVVATVNNPPSLTLSAVNGTICSGANSSLVTITSTVGDYDTYTWVPALGVSGNQNDGYTFTGISNTSHILTATQSGGSMCQNTAAFSLLVNPLPVIVSTDAMPNNFCSGGNSQLEVLISSTAKDYAFSASSGSFTPLVGGADVNSIESDDAISGALPIGFPFTFAGTNYTNVYVSSNGFISFNASAVNTPANNLTSPSSILLPLLAPLWDDLDGSATGGSKANYLTEGTTPNRVFTMEWLNWEWNYQSSTSVISFQVKLYESDNRIEFIYRQEAGSVNSGSASLGISSATGNYLSLNNTSASPTASSTSETSNLNTKPATGQIYTFTPPSFSYAWSPATFLSATNISNPMANAVTSTTEYTAQVTDQNNCSNTIMLSVNVEGSIVKNTADAGFNSLRSVYNCINEGGTITYDQPTTAATVLTTPLNITKSVTIQGLSSASRPEITVPAAGVSIDATKTLTLQNVDVKSSGTATFSGAGDVSITGTTVGKQ